MNFQSSPILPSLRVLMVNPLCSAARMTITKILSGLVFGKDQLVDLILVVYLNEKLAAEDLKLELRSCGFACMNSIEISTDLPVISDADIFCFMTNLKNPNSLDFNRIDNEQFDALYLIIKVGNSLSKPLPIIPKESDEKLVKKISVEEIKPPKPKLIIMSDGVVAMNILKYLMKNTPSEVFFCPTPLIAIAKDVLAEQLKVRADYINEFLVWAANDEVFHIEVEKPMILHDKVSQEDRCDWDMIGKEFLESFDYTNFNESWMKKEFIDKVLASASNNPYGCIYRASVFAKTLKTVWMARTAGEGKITHACVGVISDGSLLTLKGFAYVLPLILIGDTWSVSKRFEQSSHLKQEIKRMNGAVKKLIDKLIPYCKKFLKDNVINQAFIPPDDNCSESTFTYSGGDPLSPTPVTSRLTRITISTTNT